MDIYYYKSYKKYKHKYKQLCQRGGDNHITEKTRKALNQFFDDLTSLKTNLQENASKARQSFSDAYNNIRYDISNSKIPDDIKGSIDDLHVKVKDGTNKDTLKDHINAVHDNIKTALGKVGSKTQEGVDNVKIKLRGRRY